MTAVRGMGSLPATVGMSGGARDLRRLFDRLELPVDLAAEPNRKILLRDMIALFADAAGLVGDPLLGFRVGAAMSATDFGPWVDYALSADTLEGCLRRASRSLQYHQTGSTLTLAVSGDLARYTYRLDAPGQLEHRQHGDHVLPSLLSAFRRYLGQRWCPSWIEVKSLHDHRTGPLEDMVCCEVRPRAEALTIVFPTLLLSCRAAAEVDGGATAQWRRLRLLALGRPPRTVSDTVAEIAYARMIDRHFDLEGIARKLNIGLRTLQRRLEKDGAGYRTILQHIRHQQAVDLLTDTDVSITEIAFSLGYEDPAHFSRAFRRTTEMPPTRYRQLARPRCTPGAPP